MFFDYSELAVILILAIVGYFVYREHSRNKRSAMSKQNQPKLSGNDIETQLENAKAGLVEAQKIYAEQKARGATPEQLLPLQQRINNLQMIVNNEGIIRFVGPYADDIAKVILRFLK